MKIEICVNSIETAILADKLGIDRIELCSAVSVGGLTPSFGLIEACAEQTELEVNVMIRHCEGNFVYSDNDIDIMLKDIEMAKVAGANGVVFGCLTEDNSIHLDHCELLISQAKALDLNVTFHRAFDFVEDPFQSIEELIDMNFDRVLTSGLEETAIKGAKLIHQLINFSNNRIGIMAGSGINSDNILEIKNLGVDAVHFTAHQIISTSLGMGARYLPDTNKIKSILELVE